jgi:hypothetical protein
MYYSTEIIEFFNVVEVPYDLYDRFNRLFVFDSCPSLVRALSPSSIVAKVYFEIYISQIRLHALMQWGKMLEYQYEQFTVV